MKILLAEDDAAPIRSPGRTLASDLASDPGLTVLRARPGEALADAAAALRPDLVVVRLARPDRAALAVIGQVACGQLLPVVLFVGEDDPAFMQAAIDAGLSSYNVLPAAQAIDVKPILRAAAALFRRQEQAHAKLLQAQALLAERTAIDQAKGILIRERGFSEPDAYRWLRRQAMASRRRIADVATAFLREREESGAPTNAPDA